MSNIKGVFFPYQVIPCKALGAMAARALTDGVLAGCGLSFSGATLTMESGYLIACGRVMESPGPVSVQISEASSGYARVSVLIDTSKSSTKDEFEQADLYVEYSSTADGFAESYAQDVNTDGTLYQLQLCIVSLTTAGISAVIEDVPQARARERTLKTLWKNAAPSASFSAQVLSVPGIKSGELFMIRWRVNDYEREVITWHDVETLDDVLLCVSDHEATYDGYVISRKRNFTINREEETFSFRDCVYACAGSYIEYTNVLNPLEIKMLTWET